MRRPSALDISWVLVSFLFISVSNLFDWDFFLATMEIDLRGWFERGGPPHWSYQFCAGSPRAADPQSFGHSPLFLLAAVFGVFWGARLIWLLGLIAATLGWDRLLQIFYPQLSERERAPLRFVFPLSSFFLLHGFHGHLAFASFGFFTFLVALCLQSWQRPLRKSEWAWGGLVSWVGWTTGFYGGVVYLLAPFLLVFGVLALIELLRRSCRHAGRALWSTALLVGTGLLLALPKLLHAFAHFGNFRRSISTDEVMGPVGMLKAFFVPVLSGHRWAVEIPFQLYWGAWEYGFLSFFSLLLLLLPLWWWRTRFRPPTQVPAHWMVALCAAGLGLLLAWGRFGDYSPFALLNDYLLKGGVRVSGRFLYLPWLFFSLMLAGTWKFWAQKFPRPAFVLPLSFALLQTASILLPWEWGILNWQRSRAVLQAPVQDVEVMAAGVRRRTLTEIMSSMRFDVLRNHIIFTCYQPLPLPDKRSLAVLAYPEHAVPLIDWKSTPISEECARTSFVTQESLVLGASCPDRLCTLLENLNPADPLEGWAVQAGSEKRLCLVRKGR